MAPSRYPRSSPFAAFAAAADDVAATRSKLAKRDRRLADMLRILGAVPMSDGWMEVSIEGTPGALQGRARPCHASTMPTSG